MYCTWCQDINAKNIFAQEGCEWLKEEYLTRHIKIREHMNAAKGKDTRQQTLFSSFTIQYGETKAQALASMRNVYFLSKHHLALNIFPALCNLVNFTHSNYSEIIYKNLPCTIDPPSLHLEENNNFGTTNEENYATYQNPVAGREMLESLAYIIEKDTIAEINNSPLWSILLDESNTVTNEKTLAVVSKHIANNIPVIRYIGMITLNETTAEAILADLELFCIAKGLNLTRLIHFGSDGASNMTGNYFYLYIN